MGFEAPKLRPKAAAATSDYRATFAASYRIPQKTLAAATAVPPDHKRRQVSGSALRSLQSTKAVDERN